MTFSMLVLLKVFLREVENINHNPTQHKVQGIGSYLKLFFPIKPSKTITNPMGQVSISVLKVWGRHTGYYTRISNKQIPKVKDKSKIDELLINLGMPVDLLSWFEEDNRSYDVLFTCLSVGYYLISMRRLTKIHDRLLMICRSLRIGHFKPKIMKR